MNYGHCTPEPTMLSYASVVSRERIRIVMTYTSFMKFDFMASDIRNSYLQTPTSEKHYVICGPDFVLKFFGEVALITRSIYGVKVATRDFWHPLQTCMEFWGFKSILVDTDVWRREATKSDGYKYYDYVLIYTDE